MKVKRKYIGITLILLSCILLIASVNAADTNQTTTNIQTSNSTITTPTVTTNNVVQNTTTNNIKQSTTTQKEKIQTTQEVTTQKDTTNSNTQTSTNLNKTTSNIKSANSGDYESTKKINTDLNNNQATNTNTTTQDTKNNITTQTVVNTNNTQMNTQLKTLNNSTYKQVVKEDSNVPLVFNVSSNYELDQSLKNIISNGSSQENYTIELVYQKTYKLRDNYNLWNNDTNVGVNIIINCRGSGIEMPSNCTIKLANTSSLIINNMTEGYLNIRNSGLLLLNTVNITTNQNKYVLWNNGRCIWNNVNISNQIFNDYTPGVSNYGIMNLSNCLFNSNQGRTLYNKGEMSIFNCTFVKNTDENNANVYSDIRASPDPPASCNESNAYAGAIYNDGKMNINNSFMDGNGITSNVNDYLIDPFDTEWVGYGYGGCMANARGGSIYNNGILIIENTTITNSFIDTSTEPSTGYGGAIYNNGNLILIKSNINNTNSLEYTQIYGGTIYNNNGNTTIIDTNITNITIDLVACDQYEQVPSYYQPNFPHNYYGGAICNNNGTLNITSSVMDYAKVVELLHKLVINGSSIYNSGNLSVDNSDFIYNQTNATYIVYSVNDNCSLNNNTYNSNTFIPTFLNVSISNNPYNGGLLNVSVVVNSYYNNNVPVNSGYCVFKISGKTIKDENGNEIRVLVSNGTCNYSYMIPSSYTNNNRTITVVYKPDNSTYLESRQTQNFTMLTKTLINVNNITAVPGQIIEITGNITDNQGKLITEDTKVAIKINGKTLKDIYGDTLFVAVTNGTFSYQYKIPTTYKTTNYTITLTKGQTLINTQATTNTTLTINPMPTNITLNVTTNNTLLKSGETLTLTAHTSDISLDLRRVIFKINGLTIKDSQGNPLYATIQNQIATINYTIPTGLTATTYNITAVTTDLNSKRLANNTQITVQKSNTKINIKNPITLTKSQKTNLTFNITDEFNNPLNRTTKIALKLNGKIIKNIYSKNGIINTTIDTSKLNNPQYNLTIISGENGSYKTSTITTTLKLTKG